MNRPRPVLGLLVVALLGGGCASTPPRQTPLMGFVEGLHISSRELQLLVYDYAAHVSTVVEVAADSIFTRSDDPEVRHQTVLWKLYAIPSAHRAAFHADPLVAFLDCWALAAQMTRHLETGPGKDLFGPDQGVAVAAARRLENDASELGREIMGRDGARIETGVYMWVEANPVTERQFIRESGAAIFARDASLAHGGLAATGEMNQQMRELADRMALYAESVPRQIRWQSQLIMEDVSQLLAREHAGIFQDLSTQSTSFLDSFLDHREAIFQEVTRERIAVLDGISRERIAATLALSQERESVIQSLREERLATVKDMDALSRSLLAEADAHAVHVADQVFDRALRRLAAPFFALLALGFAGMSGLWWALVRRR